MNEAGGSAATGDAAAEEPLGALTQRESDLLRKAGERVFVLSRKLAESERQVAHLREASDHLRELLAETRLSRDTLAAQVSSLQRELEREYDERSELRRLLSSLQMQIQAMLPLIVAGGASERPTLAIGRTAGQRSAQPAKERNEPPLPPARVLPTPPGPTGDRGKRSRLLTVARELRGWRR